MIPSAVTKNVRTCNTLCTLSMYIYLHRLFAKGLKMVSYQSGINVILCCRRVCLCAVYAHRKQYERAKSTGGNNSEWIPVCGTAMDREQHHKCGMQIHWHRWEIPHIYSYQCRMSVSMSTLIDRSRWSSLTSPHFQYIFTFLYGWALRNSRCWSATDMYIYIE